MGRLWGWSWGAGLVFGLSLSVASTVVLLRALEERNASGSPEGRIAIGWLIVEDLAMVLALVLLPAAAPHEASSTPGGLVGLLGVTLAKVGAFVALMAFVGRRAVPWLLERVAYRPLRHRGAPKLAFLISAIGASFFLVQLAGKLFNRFPGNAFPSYYQTDRRLFSIGTADVRVLQVLIIVTAVVTMFALDRVVSKTKLGRSIRGVAEDAPTAALMGIDIDKTISRTFIIGGALAGVAGFLFATAFGFGNTMGFDQGVKAFAAAVLGGIGNIRGAMLGGLLLGLAEAVVPPLPVVGIEWTDVVAFVVLVLVLIFRPTGLLGERLGRAA